jgi:hypothetical protein
MIPSLLLPVCRHVSPPPLCVYLSSHLIAQLDLLGEDGAVAKVRGHLEKLAVAYTALGRLPEAEDALRRLLRAEPPAEQRVALLCRLADVQVITETNRICLVLFGVNKRRFGPYGSHR